jgi:hypothetical protein
MTPISLHFIHNCKDPVLKGDHILRNCELQYIHFGVTQLKSWDDPGELGMHPVVEFLSTMCEALSSCYGT